MVPDVSPGKPPVLTLPRYLCSMTNRNRTVMPVLQLCVDDGIYPRGVLVSLVSHIPLYTMDSLVWYPMIDQVPELALVLS